VIKSFSDARLISFFNTAFDNRIPTHIHRLLHRRLAVLHFAKSLPDFVPGFSVKQFDNIGVYQFPIVPDVAHPAVPGWSICSMRVPCAGDQRRAGGDIGWLGRDR